MTDSTAAFDAGRLRLDAWLERRLPGTAMYRTWSVEHGASWTITGEDMRTRRVRADREVLERHEELFPRLLPQLDDAMRAKEGSWPAKGGSWRLTENGVEAEAEG